MCVQVFFVRQGKLIERDVNLFPYYNDPDEDFLTYVGQFYQEKSHLIPNEILIPQDIDEGSGQGPSGDQGPQAPARGEEAVGQSGYQECACQSGAEVQSS